MADDSDYTVILNLVPTSLRMYVNVEKDDDEQIVLIGELKPKRHEQHVNLSTDEEFEKLKGGLRLVNTGAKGANDDKPTGWLTYHEGGYTLDVKIPNRRFDALLAAVSQGRLPSEISINVTGMTYLANSKKWDNKNRRELPIASICIFIPLIGGDPHDFMDDRTVDDSTPPTRAQFNSLLAKINRVAGNSSEIVVCLIILIVLLAVLVWRG